jgi:integrase/recombinase XerD
MLILWRRHTQTCSHSSRRYLKCRCPIWLDWRVGGKRIRKPLNTKDWTVAQTHARELEVTGVNVDIAPITIGQAAEKFLADAVARGLRESSLYKYRLLFKQLDAYYQQRGLTFLSQLNVDELRRFREGWTNRNLSARKKLEHLRTFFRFCHDSDWLKSNPAKSIKPPKSDSPPVLPFADADMKKILGACPTHREPTRAVQLRAIVLLMRYSGLRIGDAVTLARDRIQNGVLELRTAKSGTKVRVPLPPAVLDALQNIPRVNDYYFWTGVSKRKTITNDWEAVFQQLFERAGIAGHSHRLRHTFAASLLQKGVSLENVSQLLGHQSIRITEKTYASWIAGRQEHLDAAVRKTW